MTAMSETEQDPLPGLRATVRRAKASTRRAPKPLVLAETDPVARVLVDVGLAHLDRPFDYAVPASMADDALPGCRVKVRFAGRDVDAFVVERAAASDHGGRLTPLRRVVSPEPVLDPEIAQLTARVADRYAGTRSDVLRLAVPPRHATAEQRASPSAPETPVVAAPAPDWAVHEHGAAFLAHLGEGGSPRAVCDVASGADWPAMLAQAVATAYASGRGALVCTPDRRDAERVSTALETALGEGHHVLLAADAGPAARYRDFLAISRGARRIVVGTRSAAFAPVRDLGLVVIWDDGDDLYAEPRAPYPHTREVLLMRAEHQGAAMLVAGFARTVEAAYLLRSGWAREIAPTREALRSRVTVRVAGATDQELARDPYARGARIPTAAYEAIRTGLEEGPVLVSTPRAGYAPSLACERCRAPARCAVCSGPLSLRSPTTPPACRWCGALAEGWSCGECGHRGLRAPVRGDSRTAEELGHTFPQTLISRSSGDHVRAEVGDHPEIVVATPGAEPVARHGYAAVVLLDTWLTLARAELRTDEEALRRWLNAAGMVRPRGRVVAVGDPAHPALQALVRWDPAGFAERELAARREARLPPGARLATVSGAPAAVEELLAALELPPGAEVLGPVPHGEKDEWRALVRAPRSQGSALSRALGAVQRARSARKLPAVRIQVDPVAL